MNSTTENQPEPDDNQVVSDHGKVVKARHRFLSWTWLFPVLASSAALWFFWENWKSEGPEIEIHFATAPGIQADKTPIVFRGVTAGKVTEVTLDPTLKDVVVHARLKMFAKGLALQNTDFWIDQPEISLKGATGITALIQGNSIQARVRGGSYATHFKGLEKPPLVTTENPGLIAYLKAPSISFVDRGAPIYFHGTLVGMVGDKMVDENGETTLIVGFAKESAQWVKSNSRFWLLPATSLSLSPRGAQVNIAGIKTLVEGGIAFDQFSPNGVEATNNSYFTLASNEAAAKADGPPLQLRLKNGRGLLPEETRLCYLGEPIGLIESLHLDPATRTVEATARLESAYANFARSDTTFTLISPSVTPHGVSGLDTLVTGSYIACEPGTSAATTNRFICGTSAGDDSDTGDGLHLDLTAKQLPILSKGAPVYYRGLKAGKVLNTTLNPSGLPKMDIVIDPAFQEVVCANSRFWRVPATSVSAASGILSVEVQGLASLIDGGIAFDTFGLQEKKTPPASTYTLFDNEKLAGATSAPIRLFFENGRGLLPGKTEIRYLGVPVGIVESVTPLESGSVEAVAHLQPGYEFLCRSGSIFYLAHPNVSLNGGLKGIETIVSGVYIECIKGGGAWADTFVGRFDADTQLLDNQGFEIKLNASSTAIRPGALVMYRGTNVGEIAAKTLSKDGREVVLTAYILPEYRHLITDKSYFWEGNGALVKIGFIKVRITAPILTALNGQVFVTTPDPSSPPVAARHLFELHHEEPDNQP